MFLLMDLDLMRSIENIYMIHMITMILFFVILVLLFLNYRNYNRIFKFIKVELHKKRIKNFLDKYVGYAMVNAGDNLNMKYFIVEKARLLYQFSEDIIDVGISHISEKSFLGFADYYFEKIRLELRLYLTVEFEDYISDSKKQDQIVFRDAVMKLILDRKNSKHDRFIQLFQQFCQEEIVGIAGIYSNFVLNFKK